jgi:hypothetical protein
MVGAYPRSIFRVLHCRTSPANVLIYSLGIQLSPGRERLRFFADHPGRHFPETSCPDRRRLRDKADAGGGRLRARFLRGRVRPSRRPRQQDAAESSESSADSRAGSGDSQCKGGEDFWPCVGLSFDRDAY